MTVIHDDGPWRIGDTDQDDKRHIYSGDFTHDVMITVGGDFANDEERDAYMRGLVEKLNAPAHLLAEYNAVVEHLYHACRAAGHSEFSSQALASTIQDLQRAKADAEAKLKHMFPAVLAQMMERGIKARTEDENGNVVPGRTVIYGIKETAEAIAKYGSDLDLFWIPKVGDPVQVTHDYEYGEWRELDLWVSGIGMGRNGELDIVLSDAWPPKTGSETDGFRLRDIMPRRIK